MTEPRAYLNGSLVPISQATLHVFDLGVVGGVAVTEMIRTFQHQPFKLDAHLERLEKSAADVGIPIPLSRSRLNEIGRELIEENSRLIGENDELGVIYFVTAGPNPTYVGPVAEFQPTVCIHTFPLPFPLWSSRFTNGQKLITPSVRAIPGESIDPRIKCRSRMHWFLADQEARAKDPEALALVLDGSGFITETSTGNFCAVLGNEILTAPVRETLPGISLGVVKSLAEQNGIGVRHCRLALPLAFRATECFVTSTPTCIMPVVSLNGQQIGAGKPGPVVAKLIQSWSEMVGVDIAAQISGSLSATNGKKATKKPAAKGGKARG